MRDNKTLQLAEPKPVSVNCEICSRIIEEEAHYCEITDCPHKENKNIPQKPLLDEYKMTCDKITYQNHKEAENHINGLRIRQGTAKADFKRPRHRRNIKCANECREVAHFKVLIQ